MAVKQNKSRKNTDENGKYLPKNACKKMMLNGCLFHELFRSDFLLIELFQN